MGTSVELGKPQILEWFKNNEQKITRILDIGAGSGTYIKLIKENNQVCQNAEWICIEAWEPYIKEFNLKNRYNQVINSDVRIIDWETIGNFDVIVAGDVLEHMTKDEAIQLVNILINRCQTLIISIPIRYLPQGDINGNPFEVHVKPDWTHEEVLETWSNYIIDFFKRPKKSMIGVYWLSKFKI